MAAWNDYAMSIAEDLVTAFPTCPLPDMYVGTAEKFVKSLRDAVREYRKGQGIAYEEDQPDDGEQPVPAPESGRLEGAGGGISHIPMPGDVRREHGLRATMPSWTASVKSCDSRE